MFILTFANSHAIWPQPHKQYSCIDVDSMEAAVDLGQKFSKTLNVANAQNWYLNMVLDIATNQVWVMKGHAEIIKDLTGKNDQSDVKFDYDYWKYHNDDTKNMKQEIEKYKRMQTG